MKTAFKIISNLILFAFGLAAGAAIVVGVAAVWVTLK